MKDRKLFAFFRWSSAIFIAFFSIILLLYRNVILIPGGVLRHLLTQEYWVWLLEERSPAVPYEATLVSAVLMVGVLSLLLSLLGIGYLLSHSAHRKRLGRPRILSIFGIGGAVYLVAQLLLWRYAQHERLYMQLIPAAIVAGVLLWLLHCLRVEQ